MRGLVVGQWAVYECGDLKQLEPQVFRPAVPSDFDVTVGNRILFNFAPTEELP
jgi:hypothetical protein